jgi:hypothetical protein
MTLKEHYGPESERLAAFGIQPYRGRKSPARKKAPAPPEPLQNPSTEPRRRRERLAPSFQRHAAAFQRHAEAGSGTLPE